MERYRIAIIGAGPAGLSAAAHAAALDRKAGTSEPTYILLEAFRQHAKTIQRYQKGKHVMAQPGYLDLRSDLRFAEGSRERILEDWAGDLRQQQINIRYGADVRKVSGAKGDFTLQMQDGSTVAAETVVLSIGVEGNPRRIGAPGEESEGVQYQLDDPEEFTDERILVIGAGDSAIENALALTERNDVWIVNRNAEFTRAKDANLNAVLAAISDPGRRLNCFYETRIRHITRTEGNAPPLGVVLQTPTGEQEFGCHRIIARLGGEPSRDFVKSIGIRFPAGADSLPVLSRQYETNVPGAYIIGSLAGCPLIKQAMNQGYDVVEFIHGNATKPADHRLLQLQFVGLADERDVDELLDRFRSIVPMFHELNPLAFRELVIESEFLVAYPDGREYEEVAKKMSTVRASLPPPPAQPRCTRIIREGHLIYDVGEFGTSFFTLVNGSVTLESADGVRTELTRGEFFGETGLLSGRPRGEQAIAGSGCVLVETPRRTMLKLMKSNEEVRKGIDWIFIVRELQRHFAPHATFRELRAMAGRVAVRQFKAGEVIYKEGAVAASLFMLRSGNVRLSRRRDGEDVLVAQLRTGQLVGELGLMGDVQRRETATAMLASELLEVRQEEFLTLMRRPDAPLDPLQTAASHRATESARMEAQPQAGSLLNFLVSEGLGEATNVLVIDELLCVGCDNCEKACAETHGGISRLNRKAGATFANIHIPTACRHCEQPHCMKECPPNAIRRSVTGEVYIDQTCIGCGACQSNCPYGVIRMEYEATPKPGLLRWLLWGAGPGPGENAEGEPDPAAKARGKKAMKCDACVNLPDGPACVRSCPTGAAVRIGPEQLVELVEASRG